MMRTPSFWNQPPDKPNLRKALLRPFGALYAYGTARRVAKADLGYAAKCPVICVGNINAGGTGKTPTTIALIQLLQGEGLRVSVVSRGFGGTLEGQSGPQHAFGG